MTTFAIEDWVTLCQAGTFEAAHWLPFMPEGHKCRRLHGHSYRVEIRVSGKPGDDGLLVDYADIARAWDKVHAVIDHRLLNEIPGLENPTTEVLCAWVAERLNVNIIGLSEVRISESFDATWCRVLLR